MENRLNELKAEVRKLFNEINPQNTPLFSEILLILRLSRAKEWTTNDVDLLILVESMRGEYTFYEWDLILDECNTYLTEQSFPSEVEFLNEYDYFSKLIDASPLAQFERINVKNLVSELPSSTNLAELNVYLSHAFMNGFPIKCKLGQESIEEFTTQLLLVDNSIYPYILAHEILNVDFENLDLEEEYTRFNRTIRSLDQILNNAKRFYTFFEELTGKIYPGYQKSVFDPQKVHEKDIQIDNFLVHLEEVLKTDEQVLGLVTNRTWKPNKMGEFSELNIALVTNESISQATHQMLAYAQKIGNCLSAHTLEHMGKPFMLSCLFADPFLRVNISFVTPESLHFIEIEEPILRFERNNSSQKSLSEALETRSLLDGQWYEDRFWLWIYDALTEIGNDRYLQAADRIAFVRTVVFMPLLTYENSRFSPLPSIKKRVSEKNNLLNVDNPGDQLESLLTSPRTLEASSLLNYLKEMVELYRLLRIHLFHERLSYQTTTEEITMNYFEKIEKSQQIGSIFGSDQI